MDPKAQDNLDHWTHLQTIYPNGVCPLKCQCMGAAWYVVYDSLGSPMELFHDDIQMWVPGGTALPPAIPYKDSMMEIAASAYWHHQEETVNSVSAKRNHKRIYNLYLPLPPCIHNNNKEH